MERKGGTKLINNIIKLKERGLTMKEISKELGMTLGQVQYRWNKYCKQLEEMAFDIQKNEEYFGKYSFLKESILTLMVKDPHTLFVYWDISTFTKKLVENQLKKEWGDLKKKLKIYDITALHFDGHNAKRVFEIDIDEVDQFQFIDGLDANCTYIVDYGIKTNEITFLPTLRSNPIDTPRSSHEQIGLYQESVQKWTQSNDEHPEWLENFSTYSYYQKIHS